MQKPTITRMNAKTVLLLFLFALLASVNAVAQAPVLPAVNQLPGHPRIMWLKGEEQNIDLAVKNEAAYGRIHQLLLQESEAMLDLPVLERKLQGIRLLHVSGEALRRIFFLSYAWRMTQDKRFLTRAEKELQAVSAFSDWNPSHFLDVAEMTMAVSIGYDWLHPHLSQQTRELVKKAIVSKGLEPSLKPEHSSWVQRTNNWNQVCHAGMTYGALAVYEEYPELAQSIIERAVQSLPFAMKEYAPNGGYPEGYGYWGYGTTFNVLLLDALEKAFKTDFQLTSQPGFLQTGNFLLHMVGTTGKNFNYGDGTDGVGINPAMFWLAKRQQNPTLLFTEKNYLAENPAGLVQNRILPTVLIWGAGIPPKNMSAPKELVWVGNGTTPLALLRTSWTDKNAIYVGFKGGSPNTSHAQMDVGSFVMEANNERWAIDLGRQSYESLESKGVKLWEKKQNGQRWEILRNNNFFHNTLTFNDSLQRVTGTAPITGYSDNPQFLSAVANLSPVYNGQVVSSQRGVAIVDKKYVLVRDEIKTGNRGTKMRWAMVTAANVTIGPNGTAVLSQNGKKLVLQASGPGTIAFRTWPTDPVKDYDAPNPGTTIVGFETDLPAQTTSAFTILLLPENTSAKKGIEKLALEDWEVKK
ncbi:MAG: heparinase II/III domain-containing protein [Rufibacter sp.]